MIEIALTDGPVELVGALEVERTATGWLPRRLPAWTRPQVPDAFMNLIVQMPSGVRLRFRTDSSAIELDLMLTLLGFVGRPLPPATFDLVVDGTCVDRTSTSEGNVLTVGTGLDVTFSAGGPTTICFDDLPPGPKVIEVWLAQATVTELRSLRVDDGAIVEPAPPRDVPRWIHHGSSISHCVEASSPTRTWPVVAAHDAGVDVVNLGFAGQCHLDPFVARTIRDLPADAISLKLGINVVNGDTMRERAFGPAVHGFLDTIREGHPDTPILVVSPIHCPAGEDHPGPTVPDAGGRHVAVDGCEEIRSTCLTLTRIRSTLEAIVEQRRAAGDSNLAYLDGLALFGPADGDDLPDDLHPNAAGYVRMGHRFAAHAFASGGPLATRQLAGPS